MPSGAGKIFLTFFDHFLLNRVEKVLSNASVESQKEGQLLRIDSEDVQQTLFILCSSADLQSADNDNIQILIIDVNATNIQPSDLLQMRPLSTWCAQFTAKDLMDVLDNKRLIAHFQPILNVNDLSLYAHEALIRGQRDDGTIIPPNILFGQAREAELLFNLDRASRETVLSSAAHHQYFGRLFINFLPSAIYNPENCLSTTVALAKKYGFDFKNLTFEVVETERIADTEHLRHILDFYRAKGFNTALDDVGSGYSSLNLLASLAPNVIKIDRELITNIDQDPLKQAIVGGIMSMAIQSNIKTLAEGVETAQEFDYIKKIGIDLVQGFYFARPAPEPLKEYIYRHQH
jgi:EAL domain-containing protein (putative c-di-GMP-specific phosphodiesterase class I)